VLVRVNGLSLRRLAWHPSKPNLLILAMDTEVRGGSACYSGGVQSYLTRRGTDRYGRCKPALSTRLQTKPLARCR
jgi:hypothetical protein